MFNFFESIYDDGTFAERRLQIELTIINTIYWVIDREADFEKFFLGFGKKNLL